MSFRSYNSFNGVGIGPEDEPPDPDPMSSANAASVKFMEHFVQARDPNQPNGPPPPQQQPAPEPPPAAPFHPEQQAYIEHQQPPRLERRGRGNTKAVIICLAFVLTCAVVCGVVGLLIGIVYDTTGILIGLGVGLAIGALVGLFFYIVFQKRIGGKIIEYCKAQCRDYNPV